MRCQTATGQLLRVPEGAGDRSEVCRRRALLGRAELGDAGGAGAGAAGGPGLAAGRPGDGVKACTRAM